MVQVVGSSCPLLTLRPATTATLSSISSNFSEGSRSGEDCSIISANEFSRFGRGTGAGASKACSWLVDTERRHRLTSPSCSRSGSSLEPLKGGTGSMFSRLLRDSSQASSTTGPESVWNLEAASNSVRELDKCPEHLTPRRSGALHR